MNASGSHQISKSMSSAVLDDNLSRNHNYSMTNITTYLLMLQDHVIVCKSRSQDDRNHKYKNRRALYDHFILNHSFNFFDLY